MQAEFIGYTSIEKNAEFRIPNRFIDGPIVTGGDSMKYIEGKGYVTGYEYFEMRDGLSADGYVIGETYEIDGVVK